MYMYIHNRATVGLTHTQCAVMCPLFLSLCVQAIRKYLLLGQGDLIRHLMDLLA